MFFENLINFKINPSFSTSIFCQCLIGHLIGRALRSAPTHRQFENRDLQSPALDVGPIGRLAETERKPPYLFRNQVSFRKRIEHFHVIQFGVFPLRAPFSFIFLWVHRPNVFTILLALAWDIGFEIQIGCGGFQRTQDTAALTWVESNEIRHLTRAGVSLTFYRRGTALGQNNKENKGGL